MGIFRTPLTLDEVIVGHVAAMRSYADTLDESAWLWTDRQKVIARIRKCAAEVERARNLVNLAASRQGQSPNGGDVKQAPSRSDDSAAIAQTGDA